MDNAATATAWVQPAPYGLRDAYQAGFDYTPSLLKRPVGQVITICLGSFLTLLLPEATDGQRLCKIGCFVTVLMISKCGIARRLYDRVGQLTTVRHLGGVVAVSGTLTTRAFRYCCSRKGV